MRVISGIAKGTKLNSIDDIHTRPTLDRVKEPLFSIIQNYIEDAFVLDLFAGSGALGIETLSRGAKKCIFCDKSYNVIKILKQNLEKTRFIEKSIVTVSDYKKCLNEFKQEKFDIIFIDPPYKLNIAVESVKTIIENKMISKNGIIVLETDEEERDLRQLELLEKIEILDVRKYGRVRLIFLHERG